MRNYLVLLFSLFLTFESIAQKVEDNTVEEDSVVEFPDIEPSFPGGELELQKFIANNLNFPVDCMDSNFYGRIEMKFIVEEDGSISTIQINEKKLGCAQLIEEATRVLMLMPKWIPGEVQGLKKRVLVKFPLTICLKN
jgi:protein TonB